MTLVHPMTLDDLAGRTWCDGTAWWRWRAQSQWWRPCLFPRRYSWSWGLCVLSPWHEGSPSPGEEDKHSQGKLQQLECLRSEDTPPPPHHYPYYRPVHIRSWSQVKTRQSHSYKCKGFAKTSNFFNFKKKTLRPTHLLKLLDKMCKYEMDPASIVEDTERTWFCTQTERWTYGQTDKVKPVYPASTSLSRGIIIMTDWGFIDRDYHYANEWWLWIPQGLVYEKSTLYYS